MELKMYAYDIRRGDYVYLERENGKSSAGSRLVLKVAGNDDLVTITVIDGIHTIDLTLDPNEPVEVYRD